MFRGQSDIGEHTVIKTRESAELPSPGTPGFRLLVGAVVETNQFRPRDTVYCGLSTGQGQHLEFLKQIYLRLQDLVIRK